MRYRADKSTCASSEWLDWLGKDRSESPQPYQQFAAISRGMGDPELANEALYLKSEKDRNDAKGLEQIRLSTLKYTIGYGIGTGYFRALWWMMFFAGLGGLILLWQREIRRKHGWAWCFMASLDEILPVVDLDKNVPGVINRELKGKRRLWYFYFHRIVAYVLFFFVLAGLTGLTQGG
jgi:hypothetical protein